MSFPKKYKFDESEKKWQIFWQENAIYHWSKSEARENSFIVDTPPPGVSGQLHIGHVYSYTHTDFIVRHRRMKGKNVFYPMGFDDNGLPTERLVEKEKNIRANSVSRKEFINICNEVIAKEETKFRALFNRIALSVDWNLEYQTINPLSCKISQMSFLDLIEKGQIYRDSQPMLITIATTRPELLPACVSVFFHPEDKRYNYLEGQFAFTPLFNVKVPLLADDMVDPQKGTGLVMCCTFGDQTDIAWWRKHKLPTNIIISKQGRIENIQFDNSCANKIKAEQFAAQLTGLTVTAARSKIIELLKKGDLLVNQVQKLQTVKCAERSGAPLEILTTPQWFIKTIIHKEALLKKSDELNWYPKFMKIKLDRWIEGIGMDWCISRQRYFGVPFPVWYSKRAGEEGKPIFAKNHQLPVDPLVDLPEGYNKEEVIPDYDVMDTWATSSVSPQLNSHGVSNNHMVDENRYKKLFPADLRPQAHEILRTWAFYTMLKAYLHENTLPWKDIMVSGWCLAQDKSKMSKSKGNVLIPEILLEAHGSDVIRYWCASSKLGTDTAYSEDVINNGKRLVNKLWNAAKFASTHFDKISDSDKALSLCEVKHKITRDFDKYLVNQVVDLVDYADQELTNYEYATAIDKTEKFFWALFCDNYLEITKTRAYNENGEDDEGALSTHLTLYHTLKTLLQLFAPIVPHITEELFHILYAKDNSESIHMRGSWPNIREAKFTDIDETKSEDLLEILELVRKIKAQDNLSIKSPISYIEIKGIMLPDNLISDLKNVTSAKEILYVEQLTSQNQNLQINVVY